jgi:hypothetical protein
MSTLSNSLLQSLHTVRPMFFVQQIGLFRVVHCSELEWDQGLRFKLGPKNLGQF